MATDKPKIDLNLDTLPEENTEPFAVVYKGKRYTLPHIDELDAWTLVDAFSRGEAAATVDILAAAFGDAFEEFKALGISRGKMTKLVNAYLKHGGIETGN